MNRQSWRARSREAQGGVRGGHGEGISRKPHLSSPQPPPDGGPCWGMAVEGTVGRRLSGWETQVRSCSTWSGNGHEGLRTGRSCHRGPSPVDEVLVLVALHLVLNGGLQVPDALER